MATYRAEFWIHPLRPRFYGNLEGPKQKWSGVCQKVAAPSRNALHSHPPTWTLTGGFWKTIFLQKGPWPFWSSNGLAHGLSSRLSCLGQRRKQRGSRLFFSWLPCSEQLPLPFGPPTCHRFSRWFYYPLREGFKSGLSKSLEPSQGLESPCLGLPLAQCSSSHACRLPSGMHLLHMFLLGFLYRACLHDKSSLTFKAFAMLVRYCTNRGHSHDITWGIPLGSQVQFQPKPTT